jgi:hypothetical protein
MKTLLLLLALLVQVMAYGQKAALKGTVTGSGTKAPLSSVLLVIENAAAKDTTVSDSLGRYAFAGLLPGI